MNPLAKRRSLPSVAAAVLIALAPDVQTAAAQDFPSKPIRIVATEPGGGSDFVARVIAQGLTAALGQQVIVENRGGASGIIAAQLVARSPADGHTLYCPGNSFWTIPLLQKAPYDVLRDFTPITLADRSPNVLAVHPSLPVKTAGDLIRLAKARPGELAYAGGSTGSSNHLSGELFRQMAGVDLLRVPYKGSLPGLNDTVSGQVQIIFVTAVAGAPLVKAGRLKALGVTSLQPSTVFPGLPTVASSGLPGFEADVSHGLFAPAKLPPALLSRLHQEVTKLLTQPDVKERLLGIGVETVANTPEAFVDMLKSEVDKWGKVIRYANIRAE
jgi:tripartite-type tricarboxylate transporter receptor subunit TctC